MSSRLIKLAIIVGGVILVYIAVFFIRGQGDDGKTRAEIEFWNVFDKSEVMDPFIDAFERNYDVRVNYRNFTNIDEYRETLLLELAAGEGPDVLAIHNSWVPKYRTLLEPLPGEMLLTPESIRDNFVDAVADGMVLEKNDKDTQYRKQNDPNFVPEKEILGLPMYVDTPAIYYNKAIFRNVLSKSYPAPELTWAGVEQDVIDLTRPNVADDEGFRLAGIAMGRTDNISRGVDIFYNLYAQFGGRNLQKSDESGRDDQGKSYEPLAAAFDFMTGFSRNPQYQQYSWNVQMGLNAPEKELDAFVRGKVAMIIGYSYYYEDIKNLIRQFGSIGSKDMISMNDVDIAPFPQIYDPNEGNPKLVLADYFALAVPKTSDYPYESWQLILELTRPGTLQEYYDETGKPTSRRELIEEQKSDQLFGVFSDQSVYATVLPVADYEKYDLVIREVVTAVNSGELELEAAASELRSKIKVVEDRYE